MKIDVEVILTVELISEKIIDLSIYGKLYSTSMPLQGSQIFYPYGEDESTSPHYQCDMGISLIVIEAAHTTGPRPGTILPLLTLGQTVNAEPDGELLPIKDLTDLKSMFEGLLLLLEDPHVRWGLKDIVCQPLREAIEQTPEQVRQNLSLEAR